MPIGTVPYKFGLRSYLIGFGFFDAHGASIFRIEAGGIGVCKLISSLNNTLSESKKQDFSKKLLVSFFLSLITWNAMWKVGENSTSLR